MPRGKRAQKAFYIEAVLSWYMAGESLRDIQVLFQERFPGVKVPSIGTLSSWTSGQNIPANTTPKPPIIPHIEHNHNHSHNHHNYNHHHHTSLSIEGDVGVDFSQINEARDWNMEMAREASAEVQRYKDSGDEKARAKAEDRADRFFRGAIHAMLSRSRIIEAIGKTKLALSLAKAGQESSEVDERSSLNAYLEANPTINVTPDGTP